MMSRLKTTLAVTPLLLALIAPVAPAIAQQPTTRKAAAAKEATAGKVNLIADGPLFVAHFDGPDKLRSKLSDSFGQKQLQRLSELDSHQSGIERWIEPRYLVPGQGGNPAGNLEGLGVQPLGLGRSDLSVEQTPRPEVLDDHQLVLGLTEEDLGDSYSDVR